MPPFSLVLLEVLIIHSKNRLHLLTDSCRRREELMQKSRPVVLHEISTSSKAFFADDYVRFTGVVK